MHWLVPSQEELQHLAHLRELSRLQREIFLDTARRLAEGKRQASSGVNVIPIRGISAHR